MTVSTVMPEINVFEGERILPHSLPRAVYRGSGAKGLDHATIDLILTEPNRNLDLVIKSQNIEVSIESDTGLNPNRDPNIFVFWGRTSGASATFSARESIAFEARVMPSHFGVVCGKCKEYIQGSGTSVDVVGDYVFNPVFDGVLRGNMTPRKPYLFLDPLRTMTRPAYKFATGLSLPTRRPISDFDKRWTIRKAAEFLCSGNHGFATEKRYISEPSTYTVLSDDDGDDEFLIRNLRIPIGTSLPEALDLLLTPFGYSWFVKYVGRGTRRIEFYERGRGTKKRVKLQKPGEFVSFEKTNTNDVSCAVGTQSLVNSVRVVGDRKLFEGTFTLKRAWPAAQDSATEDDTSLEAINTALPSTTYWRVHRDWVLDEAGDYIGVRESYKSPYSLEGVFGDDSEYAPRRRRFYPCISLGDDRKPLGEGGFVLEWRDGDDGTWKPLNGASFSVLRDECGIRFTGSIPPDELVTATDPQLRITCSIEADECVEATSRPGSIQDDEVLEVVHSPDLFLFRKISDTSIYKSQSQRTGNHNEVDDTERAEQFAKRITDTWNKADFSGNATIIGLDSDNYQIGDLITGIEGREIDFELGAQGEKQYPQIVGITYDFRRQRRVLHLESFRNSRVR